MGVGIVVRDSDGRVVAAIATVIQFIFDPPPAEAMAAWRAVLLCRKLGFTHMIFEGDSLSIVFALNSESPCWHRYGHVIEDVRIWL